VQIVAQCAVLVQICTPLLLEHLGMAFVCLTLHQAHAILTKDNKLKYGSPSCRAMESYYLGMKLRSPCSSGPNLYLLEHLGTAFVCRTLHCSHAILTKDNKDTGNPTEERWNLIWARSSEARANCCLMCSSSPNLCPASPGTFGDGFRLSDSSSSTCNLN
jgi:hypothetical protein